MIQIVFAILIGISIFLIAADLLRIPHIKTSRAFRSLSKRQKKKTSLLELGLQGAARFIARHLKLNDYRRLQLVSDLQTAGMEITAELYIAVAVIKAGLCGLLAIPAFFIFPLIVPLVIVLAILMYFKEAKSVQTRIAKRREAIEYELPRLVSTIEKTLMHSRDVLGILETYKRNAGAALKGELSVTVADMRSGNYESALTRLESRVGSAMLSDVVRGLISVLRGDETDAYWATLSIKFADIQRQNLKRQAQKVPGKVRRLSMVLLFCFIAVYLVVIITQIMHSLGAMFG